MGNMEQESVEESIKELGERFKKNPLRFTVETSLLAELQKIMKGRMETEKIEVEAKYKDFEEDSDHEEDYTNYKEKYLKRICNQKEISEVQIEVNIGEKGRNRLLDLAVLGEKVKIYLVNGTKYFKKESIEHAVELKFIKNKNVPPKEITDFFSRDIKKLEKVSQADSKHLVIFSNKNIFQREVDSKSKEEINDDKYTDDAHDRIDALVDHCGDKDIKLYHYFPL